MNKTFFRSMAATSCMMALAGLTCAAITAGLYSSDLQIKEHQISELERALDVMEEANESLKSESKVTQLNFAWCVPDYCLWI